jgi:quercetin dioxygenase-like cupin family protein
MATLSKTRAVEWMGTQYKILLTPDQTGKNIGMFESLDQPGYGPPRHIHHQEDETFYVLTGDVEFWMKGCSTTHGPGDVVFIPRGVEHTFRISSETPARMLTIMTPGGFENFFIEMEANRLRIPDDMKQVVSIGEKYHMSFTGPPLGAH